MKLGIKLPWSKRKGPYVAMCSMGGVGSTALARHIGSISDKSVREHAFSPSVYDDEEGIRLGYMFGNPYDSVLSLFRRGYQDMHAKAMNVNSGTPATKLKGVTLEDFLEAGIDEFRIERQFDNWVNPDNAKHPTLLIKYEPLAGHLDEVLQFFGSTEPFEFKQRRCAWEEQPKHIQDGLEKIYGGIKAKIDAMPSISIIGPDQ